jgi:hypothetical protein
LKDAVANREVAVAGCEKPRRSAPELGDLAIGEPRPAFECLGPLERSGGVYKPDTLKIGLTVGRARW